MSLTVHSLAGQEVGKLNNPVSVPVRPDLIRKAVLVEQSWRIHPYGADPMAGQRSSAHYIGRRGAYHSMMNREISRMMRVVNQGFLNLTARVVPQAAKGRKAHPPKSWKVWDKKINKKERDLALRSAIAATFDRDYVQGRGHRIDNVKHIPLVVESGVESVKKAKDVIAMLGKLGLEDELSRCSSRKVRSGKGKLRGRKYRTVKGPLIVASEDKGILKAAAGIAGVDAVLAKDLSVEDLAPGTHPGRLTIWSRSVLEAMK
jgi:large subunit ribosomal protein L4e